MDNNYEKLVKKLEENTSIVMMTKLISKDNGKIEKVLLDSSKWNSFESSEEMKVSIKKVIDKKLPELFKDEDGNQILLEPFFPESRMIVFGGGNISEHLVKLGSDVGFKVTVVDDRLTYANKDRFPTASEVICESFDKVFDKLKIHRNDYVVIVTRGHKYDKECLREVLNIKPEYLGMIGSKRRVKGIKDQLIEEGYEAGLLESMCSPIGFKIGGITPLEIAISIISQIIAQKRLGVSDMMSCANAKRRVNYSDIDREVLENLAKSEEEKKAIV
ncbi:XdhC family protein, partial [Clostridium sp.]|uniref:XdhC family protein n=1 Tax=Clostridium sp. TaxID=1506 RepID=UPI00261C80E2